MLFSEMLCGVAPHLKAAVAAFPILAFEGGLTVFLDGIESHGGLLFSLRKSARSFWSNNGTSRLLRTGPTPLSFEYRRFKVSGFAVGCQGLESIL